MRNVTLEFDGSGTLQGANNMLASARDWARFGLLYLNDGMVGGQAHPASRTGWISSRCRDARHRLCRGLLDQPQRASEREGPRARSAFPATPFMPPAISASAVVIIPSQHMVVVRLGDSVDPTGDMRGLARLIKEVIAATDQ